MRQPAFAPELAHARPGQTWTDRSAAPGAFSLSAYAGWSPSLVRTHSPISRKETHDARLQLAAFRRPVMGRRCAPALLVHLSRQTSATAAVASVPDGAHGPRHGAARAPCRLALVGHGPDRQRARDAAGPGGLPVHPSSADPGLAAELAPLPADRPRAGRFVLDRAGVYRQPVKTHGPAHNRALMRSSSATRPGSCSAWRFDLQTPDACGKGATP